MSGHQHLDVSQQESFQTCKATRPAGASAAAHGAVSRIVLSQFESVECTVRAPRNDEEVFGAEMLIIVQMLNGLKIPYEPVAEM